MPLLNGDLDNLPHLDSNPSPGEREDALAQIATELNTLTPNHSTTLHPQVADRFSREALFPPITAAAHAVIVAHNGQKVSSAGIDTSRYEAPSGPADIKDKVAWKYVLKNAYTARAYLEGRRENLKALDENGRNAWVLSNNDIEKGLKMMEDDLKAMRAQGLYIDEERRLRQEGVRGEFEGLEETWKGSLGRAVEAEIAVDKLKESVTEKRRKLGHEPDADG